MHNPRFESPQRVPHRTNQAGVIPPGDLPRGVPQFQALDPIRQRMLVIGTARRQQAQVAYLVPGLRQLGQEAMIMRRVAAGEVQDAHHVPSIVQRSASPAGMSTRAVVPMAASTSYGWMLPAGEGLSTSIIARVIRSPALISRAARRQRR